MHVNIFYQVQAVLGHINQHLRSSNCLGADTNQSILVQVVEKDDKVSSDDKNKLVKACSRAAALDLVPFSLFEKQ